MWAPPVQRGLSGRVRSTADARFGEAAIKDDACTFAFGWFVKRASPRSNKWHAVVEIYNGFQDCSAFRRVMPNGVVRDFQLHGSFGLDLGGGPCWNPSGSPRIYSTPFPTPTFEVRPHDISLDSAHGGDLILRYSLWNQRGGFGRGSSHPDHGSYAIRVHPWGEYEGLFTHLDVQFKHHIEHLIIANASFGLMWANASEFSVPGLGLTPWPG